MSSSGEELAIVLEEENFGKRRKRKRVWVHEICKRRSVFGEYVHLFPDLMKDEKKFFSYFRMTRIKFHLLLESIREAITEEKCLSRKPIGADERLMICLRFLATGNSYKSMAYTFRMGESTIRKIVYKTCEAIWDKLQPTEMPQPSEHRLKEIEKKFWQCWNFPNLIGAIDGKHVIIQAPPITGSLYFSYKKSFSVVLLALVSADYKFVVIDVGSYGKNSDGAIFSSSPLGQLLRSKQLQIPPDKALPGTNIILPHVIVGDEAFPLSVNLMRPYPGHQTANNEENRIFNYRLSRARRVSENSFGLLVKKFRIYERTISMTPEHVNVVVKATCVLHNYLREDICYWTEDDQGEVCAASEVFRPLLGIGGNHAQQALQVREQLKNYFVSPEGAVDWQLQEVRGGRRNIN